MPLTRCKAHPAVGVRFFLCGLFSASGVLLVYSKSMTHARKLVWVLGVVVLIVAAVFGVQYFTARQMPDLDRPFTPAERFPESIREESINNVNAAIAELKDNPDLISRWLQIAVYRKGADDFEGAEEIWLYLTHKWPDDPTAYANLADLYQSVLNEPQKAETYWKKYLKVAPEGYDISGYRSLHDLYRTKLANPEKARAILLEGIEEHPDTTDLLIPLAVFERDNGSKEEAMKYFIEAQRVAESLGNTALVDLLAEELGKLME
jgi:tetratricopeptide (TPR) repeat protein